MKHRNISPLLLFLFLLITAFSCTKDPKVEPIIPKGRTLLVYIAGDGKKGQSNLSGEVEFAQAALMKGWDNQTMGPLVIFADRNNSSPVGQYQLSVDANSLPKNVYTNFEPQDVVVIADKPIEIPDIELQIKQRKIEIKRFGN